MPQGNPEEYLREALELVRMYAADPSIDDIDTEAAEKITSLIQGILATGQKEQQDMMQGKLSPRAMSKAYGAATSSMGPLGG